MPCSCCMTLPPQSAFKLSWISLQALEALRLLQDAQSAFDESTVTTSSAQSSKMAPCQEGLPTHVLSGSRISVFWPDDQTYYRVSKQDL